MEIKDKIEVTKWILEFLSNCNTFKTTSLNYSVYKFSFVSVCGKNYYGLCAVLARLYFNIDEESNYKDTYIRELFKFAKVDPKETPFLFENDENILTNRIELLNNYLKHLEKTK